MKALLAPVLALAVLLTAGASRADVDPLLAGTPSEETKEDEEPSRPALGLAAGAALSFVSLAGGTTALVRSETRVGKNRGLLLGQGGLCLAPFLAHAVVGEWGRGALFSILPLLAEGGMIALTTKAPDIVTTGPAPEQLAFIALLATSIFGAGIGVVDVAKADERAAARKRRALEGLQLTPIFGRGLGGLAVGGWL